MQLRRVRLLAPMGDRALVRQCGSAIGIPRPSLPVPVFAEDFSLLVQMRTPKRLRITRGKIRVLS